MTVVALLAAAGLVLTRGGSGTDAVDTSGEVGDVSVVPSPGPTETATDVPTEDPTSDPPHISDHTKRRRTRRATRSRPRGATS